MNNKLLLKLFLVINTVILITSFSIAIVLLCRPFYYIHIKLLNLEQTSGYTYSEIKEAYDDVMNYSIFNKEFKTGKLKYSSEGKNHFKDCKKLFLLDFILLGISTIIFLLKKKYKNNIKIRNHTIEYWSSILIIIILLTILIFSIIFGFNKSFECFHKLFFLGKTNWKFNPSKDEIINILPKQFFMNCSIFILLLITTITLGFLIEDNRIKKRNTRN